MDSIDIKQPKIFKTSRFLPVISYDVKFEGKSFRTGRIFLKAFKQCEPIFFTSRGTKMVRGFYKEDSQI